MSEESEESEELMEESEEQSFSSLSSEHPHPHHHLHSHSTTTSFVKTRRSKVKEKRENNVLADVKTLSEWSSNDESRYKSHFFYLQLTELLREMQINYDLLETSFQSWLSRVKRCWNTLSERVIRSCDYTSKYSALRLHNTDLTFVFHKPARVTVVGSYTTHTLLKSRFNIDVAVLLPAVRLLSLSLSVILQYHQHFIIESCCFSLDLLLLCCVSLMTPSEVFVRKMPKISVIRTSALCICWFSVRQYNRVRDWSGR